MIVGLRQPVWRWREGQWAHYIYTKYRKGKCKWSEKTQDKVMTCWVIK